MQVSSRTIAAIVQIGQTDVNDGECHSLCNGLKAEGDLNRLHWSVWDSATEAMNLSELGGLLRGLIRLEKANGWIGGSVAAAIWVFKIFQRRFPESSHALADWALANSDNPWVPFGTNRGGIRSLNEYLDWQRARTERRNTRAIEVELERHLRQVREKVARRLAVERRAIQNATSSARRELLFELSNMTLKERVEHIAWDTVHPLSYYPVDLVLTGQGDCEPVDTISFQRLINKARARMRGPWRAWANAVTSTPNQPPSASDLHA